MRSALAFLFALLILVCWMRGFHMQYLDGHGDDPEDPTAIELTRQLENALLEGQALRVVDRAFNGRRGWAYPSDFVYSAAIEGDTAYFILHEKASEEGTFVVVNLPDSEREMPVRPQNEADHPIWYLATIYHPAFTAAPANAFLSLWPTSRSLYAVQATDLLSPPPES